MIKTINKNDKENISCYLNFLKIHVGLIDILSVHVDLSKYQISNFLNKIVR